MQKINFQDLPNTTTPIDANNLNLLQDNIENDIGDLSELETTEKTDLVSAINEANQHGSGGGGETLPVGAEIEFDGQSTDIPTGWEEITNPDSYSTTEIKTNKTWIDGKPIYRKVINIGSITNTTSNNTVNPNISNLDTLISLDGIFNIGANRIPINFHNSVTASGGIGFCCFFQASDNLLYILCKSAINSGYVVMEYTKTTD